MNIQCDLRDSLISLCYLWFSSNPIHTYIHALCVIENTHNQHIPFFILNCFQYFTTFSIFATLIEFVQTVLGYNNIVFP